MHRKSIPMGLAAALLFIAACGPTPDETPEILASGPDKVLDPEATGPYPVGVRTYTVTDTTRPDPISNTGDRVFRVEIWYPAVPEAVDAPLDVLDLLDEAPQDIIDRLGTVTPPTLEQPAHRDVAPREDQGRFPVVLFSHGNGGIRAQSFHYTAHLASHGYVVIAPDHTGNTLFELVDETDLEGAAIRSATDRPQDLSLILDLISDGELTGGELEPIMDDRNVGVSGHSFGGLTSLLIVNPDSEFYDDRIDAAVPVTPATEILAIFAAKPDIVTIPTFYVGATEDNTLDYQIETLDAYAIMTSDKGVGGVVKAGHFSFTEICDLDLVPLAEQLGMASDITNLLSDGCGDTNIAIPRAHALMGRYGAGWFNTYLRGASGTMAEHLDPTVQPADVEYQLSATAP